MVCFRLKLEQNSLQWMSGIAGHRQVIDMIGDQDGYSFRN